ncbi:MAG: hypothetical protein NW223_08215 [Hyphomicrobiaceae bacterium]|nr:hypothetical protein [Hyphomicrobiaceae bacterium]
MSRILAAAWLGLLLALAGCAQTSRVDANTSTQALAEKRTAVALVRIGEAGQLCRHVSIMIGVREGDGFRGTRVLNVANVRSITEAPVAEVELPPGEYHLLAYRCRNDRHRAVAVGDIADKPGVFRSSFAKFTLEPGEIVNLGYLHFNAHRVGQSAFGRPLRSQIFVTDWPVAELERFKAARPQLYAQMRTRHMQLMDDEGPDAATCAKLRNLKTEGKVQTLPTECQPAKAATKG